MRKPVTVLAFVVFSVCGFAQTTHYIRAGAGGSNDGTDWINAFSSIPATLTRGDTYYIADGSYGSYSFDDAESGTTLITIQKASSSDHGTETGWVSTYGDGEATFSSVVFGRDYYVLDGAYRNESTWDDAGSYGIRITSIKVWPIQGGAYAPGGDHITVQYAEIGNTYSESNNAVDDGVYLVYNTGSGTDFTLSRCYIHNTLTQVYLLNYTNVTVEYSYLGPGWQKEGIRGRDNVSGTTIRYNIFRDSSYGTGGEGGGSTAPIAMWSGGAGNFDDIVIHGNVIWDAASTDHSGGSIVLGGDGSSWVGSPANDCRVYNNTFVGVRSTNSGILINGGTGNRAYNNIWYDCAGTGTAGSGLSVGNNSVIGTDPFADYTTGAITGSMRLAAASDPIDAGASQTNDNGQSYDVDMDGNTRGSDGIWDQGAYEYDSGSPPPETFRRSPSRAARTGALPFLP